MQPGGRIKTNNEEFLFSNSRFLQKQVHRFMLRKGHTLYKLIENRTIVKRRNDCINMNNLSSRKFLQPIGINQNTEDVET